MDTPCHRRCGTLKNPYFSMATSAIGQNMKPFTGNDNVSVWVKNSGVGRKAPKKQKHCFWNNAYWQPRMAVNYCKPSTLCTNVNWRNDYIFISDNLSHPLSNIYLRKAPAIEINDPLGIILESNSNEKWTLEIKHIIIVGWWLL